MNATRSLPLIVLAVCTLGLGALSYRQYQELLRLRGAASVDPKLVAELQARIDALGREKHDLQAALDARDAAKAKSTDVAEDTPPGDDGAPDQQDQRGNRRGFNPQQMRERFQKLLADNPDFAKALSTQQKAGLDQRYAALFAKLGLPAAQLDQLKALMVERENAWQDVMGAAQAQGLQGREARDAMRTLMQQAQADVDTQISSLLGDSAYSTYSNYITNEAQYNTASEVANILSYTPGSQSLSDFQTDQLVKLMADTGTTGRGGDRGGPGGLMGGFGGGNSRTALVTDDVIAQAQTFLTPAQVESLKQVQAQQQAQQTVVSTMRQQLEGGRGRGGNGGGPGGG